MRHRHQVEALLAGFLEFIQRRVDCQPLFAGMLTVGFARFHPHSLVMKNTLKMLQ